MRQIDEKNSQEVTFKDGDLVRIKDKWLDDPEERATIFVVVEVRIYDFKKSCFIRPTNGPLSKLPLVPIEQVAFEMIEPTGFNCFEKYD